MTTEGTTPASSPAAERMRRHRERRRDGLRCLMIELRETEIDALVQKGLLMRDNSQNPEAIIAALYELLDRTLDDTVTRNSMKA
jgi:hypothetical protein